MPSEEHKLTLDQQRAKHALARVREVADENYKTQYRAYVRSLPLQLTMNGLGQTIALEMAGMSRDGAIGDGHRAVLRHALHWLASGTAGWETSPYAASNQPPGEDVLNEGGALLNAIMDQDESDMLRAQQELMAYLKWLKTFAEALIPPPEREDA